MCFTSILKTCLQPIYEQCGNKYAVCVIFVLYFLMLAHAQWTLANWLEYQQTVYCSRNGVRT